MRIGICNENNYMRIKIRETLCKILQERKIRYVITELILFGKKLPVAERRRKEVMERYIRFCNKMRQ